MPHGHQTALAAALDLLPQKWRGPGGVALVVRDGVAIAARAWGYADLDRHRPMTRTTRLPICSISKQFTCGVLLATAGEPEALDSRLPALLPALEGPMPTVRQLCHNQSGLRDYWAMTVIEGARAEQTFRREDALPMIAAIRSGHFAPGTGYSYCNCNYRLLSEMIEASTDASLETLYRRHIWGPAGMKTAVLTSDTRHPADEVVGYEGSDATGYFPADNGIFWIGDAGISASLDDMIAYERWIDATLHDPASLYRRLSAPSSFADGTPARYGFGLAREVVSGVEVTGHGGALRGFRAHRMHSADHRLSVMVMFNHDASAHDAAASLLRAALGLAEDEPRPLSPGWAGQWLCEATGLFARIEVANGNARLHFATGAEEMTEDADGRLVATGCVVEREGGALLMHRLRDNIVTVMQPVREVAVADGGEIAGDYRCGETGGKMRIEARDGATFASFTGRLGDGPMAPVIPAAPDVWLVRTRRSMDAPAPGDWTLRVRRDGARKVTGAGLGCWLARGLDYRRG